MARRNDIPSLTGLRGIAAWLVVIAHTDGFFVALQPAWLEYAWRVCANLGMTTFFVLSGFVIHYNYGASIAAKGAPAIRSFLIARFARLYPLYLLALLISIALSPSRITVPPRQHFGDLKDAPLVCQLFHPQRCQEHDIAWLSLGFHIVKGSCG